MTDGAAAPDELLLRDRAAWRAWLDEHEDSSDGAWLVIAKKGTTDPTSLTYDEALVEALCSGWIDGQRRSRDAATSLQRMTPRRARSMWSQRNVARVEQLTAEGRMRPRGLAEVERARADGRWEAAYAGPATMAVPDDLSAALAARPRAAEAFATLTGQNRYSVLHRITTARTPETRARRMARLVDALERGETPYPQPWRPE